jgi:hypothetical protein
LLQQLAMADPALGPAFLANLDEKSKNPSSQEDRAMTISTMSSKGSGGQELPPLTIYLRRKLF